MATSPISVSQRDRSSSPLAASAMPTTVVVAATFKSVRVAPSRGFERSGLGMARFRFPRTRYGRKTLTK